MASHSRGPLRVFRLADRRQPLFDGVGAYLKGGRWNSPGRRVIYAAQTYAGALLEALVHLNFDEIPDSYGWIEILIHQETEIEELAANEIPAWNAEDFTLTRGYGDGWHAQRRTSVLLVPSVVTAGVEQNVLINQDHPNFAGIQASEVHEVLWDERLFQRRA